MLKNVPSLLPIVVVAHLFAIVLIDKYFWEKPFFNHKRMLWNFLLLNANVISAIINIEVNLLIGSFINIYVALAGMYIFRG